MIPYYPGWDDCFLCNPELWYWDEWYDYDDDWGPEPLEWYDV